MVTLLDTEASHEFYLIIDSDIYKLIDKYSSTLTGFSPTTVNRFMTESVHKQAISAKREL